MKPKISKILVPPMLYGIVASWLVTLIFDVLVLCFSKSVLAFTLIGTSSAIILVLAWSCLRRAAWVYSNARKHHSAEYFYSLGNGEGDVKAVAYFERKVKRALYVWLRRDMVNPVFVYLILVLMTGAWVRSLFVFVVLAVVALALWVGVWTMLLAARRICYDKFGNIKNR